MWVQCYGHIEIGDQEGFGFIVKVLGSRTASLAR